ncbi:SIR2 family protein [Agrobacterium cavarae]|uniref:SIR2 family protein n=1 Tax=Agrobacterium cavarae TaxID=2528239 RepID=UPI003FCF6EF8
MSNGVILGTGLPELPEELLLARDQGRVLFIVGAGASYPQPSNLPGFGGLVGQIYDIADPSMSEAIRSVTADGGPKWQDVPDLLNHEQRTELKFLCQGEFDVALGMLERRIDGDPSKESTMRRAATAVLSRTTEPNPIHSALVQLGQRYGQTLLVTTNFDRLLSEAARRLRVSHETFARGEIPNPSTSRDFGGILHIHGKLGWRKEKGSSLILTDQDFGDSYLRRNLITSFLYDAARIFHIVLVGYSANDSPVRYLLNAIAADERHFVDLKRRYAFVGCEANDERTGVEWQSRGITPIVYDKANDHRVLGDLLVRWAEIIPEKRNETSLKSYLKELGRLDPDSSEGAAARSFIQYYARRSTPSEQNQLAKILSRANQPPRWLTLLNQVIRDSARAR